MRPAETAARLSEFTGRGAGTDAERRAAQWLAAQVRSGSGERTVTVETFWARPNWALAQFWHCLPAIAGSLLMVHDPRLGGALVLAALLSVLLDGLAGVSPGRRLTRERASQNVVSRTSAADENGSPAVRLVITTNYDAPRTGLLRRAARRHPTAPGRPTAPSRPTAPGRPTAPSRSTAPLRSTAPSCPTAPNRPTTHGPRTPGWLGWLALTLLWLVGVAAARSAGAGGTGIAVVQLVPTAALVVAAALLLDQAQAPYVSGAADAAVGTALALVRALDVSPPPQLAVELVLQGAGDGEMTGLRRHLQTHRPDPRPSDTIVLGIAVQEGIPLAWWVNDGPLIPLRFHQRLRALAGRAAITAIPRRSRGTTPAFPARLRGLPALTIGGSPQHADALLEQALMLVDALDADLTRSPQSGPPARTAARAG